VFTLDFSDRRPIYEQIKDNIKEMILRGILKENEKIPSVRELAVMLTINPNTIQKAYRDLENEGYIHTVKGRGSFVTSHAHNLTKLKVLEVKKEFEKSAKTLKELGEEEESLILMVRNIYHGEEEK